MRIIVQCLVKEKELNLIDFEARRSLRMIDTVRSDFDYEFRKIYGSSIFDEEFMNCTSNKTIGCVDLDHFTLNSIEDIDKTIELLNNIKANFKKD